MHNSIFQEYFSVTGMDIVWGMFYGVGVTACVRVSACARRPDAPSGTIRSNCLGGKDFCQSLVSHIFCLHLGFTRLIVPHTEFEWWDGREGEDSSGGRSEPHYD